MKYEKEETVAREKKGAEQIKRGVFSASCEPSCERIKDLLSS